jgi:membrane associated rhomboid family serine protease
MKKESLFHTARMLVLPAVLIAIYALQHYFPAIHRQGALWSDHPQWWQFFTCNFLSADLGHLSMNAGGLVVVYSQFAPRIRAPFLWVAFVVFSSVSAWVFFHLCMPSHAWVIGASGGSFALLGFFSWFLRRARFQLYKFERVGFPILPVLIAGILCEALFARWRMPQLAWQLHALGFALGISTAMVAHAVYAAAGLMAERSKADGMPHRIGALVSVGIWRMKQISEIQGTIRG